MGTSRTAASAQYRQAPPGRAEWEHPGTRRRRGGMDEIGGLYVLRFGSPASWGAGVIVLETQRFFGGDSMYYYVGDYTLNRSEITGSGKVVLHTAVPGVPTIFGDPAAEFEVALKGTVAGDTISGWMSRLDMPGAIHGVVMTFREKLP